VVDDQELHDSKEKAMRVTIRKWGNNAFVRIPPAIMDAAMMRLDQPVNVREERGCIIIEPECAPAFDLDAIVAWITNDNRYGEIDFGPSVDNEIP
jgi:antitoxin MazE